MYHIRIRFIKVFDKKEKKFLQKQVFEEFGSLDRLKQKVSRTGCREPELVDKLKIIECLQKGADYKEEVISHDEKSLSALTPKRIQIMEYVSNNTVGSIQELAQKLNRDYKNVYDDVRALSDNGLIELNKEGKRRVPVLKADNILIEF